MDKIALIKKGIYFVLLPVVGILAIATFVRWYDTSSAITQNDAEIASLNTRILDNRPNTIRVDSNGSENSLRVKDVKQLTSIFTKMTTWTNGKQYTDNRNEALKIIKGDEFYKKMYVEDKDTTGQSVIDSLGTKSKTNSVSVYQVSPTQFRVIFSSYGYKNSDDLSSVTVPNSKTYSVLVEGTLNHWNVVRIDEGFTAQ